MEQITLLAKALADKTRVRIINLLRQEQLCVCELADVLSVAQSTLSTHLQSLRASKAVETEKRQTWIIYRLSTESRQPLTVFLDSVGPDAQLLRDSERLRRRLHLRVEGCCVLGAVALPREQAHAN